MSRVPAPVAGGLVIVDKPSGRTSHDVVGRMRKIAHTRKVGHAGTLDPMATGVLVLGVGGATRLLHHLVLADKAYTGSVIANDANKRFFEPAPGRQWGLGVVAAYAF